MKIPFFLIFVTFLMGVSCSNQVENPRELVIGDLPFHKVQSKKEYSDLIMKAIRTNRDKPIYQEFELNEISVDADDLNTLVGMYSSGIGGRDDWNFYDIARLSGRGDDIDEFDYAWLDQTDRLGIQILIGVDEEGGKFRLQKIEFRSRLDVIESKSFPGGVIDDYKKIDYDWVRR